MKDSWLMEAKKKIVRDILKLLTKLVNMNVVNMDYLLFDNPRYKSCTFPFVN